jgi:hypothetical protein
MVPLTRAPPTTTEELSADLQTGSGGVGGGGAYIWAPRGLGHIAFGSLEPQSWASAVRGILLRRHLLEMVVRNQYAHPLLCFVADLLARDF